MNDPAGSEKSRLICFYDYMHTAICIFDLYHIFSALPLRPYNVHLSCSSLRLAIQQICEDAT